MAPRLPQTADVEIYDILNRSIETGASIPDIQFRQLINKATKIPAPYNYACLSALYAHTLNYDKVAENARKSIRFGATEESCVINAVSALSNMKMFSEIVEMSKEYPILLEYKESRYETYDAAFHVLELEYCEYIANKFNISFTQGVFDYRLLKSHFCEDKALIKRASEYLKYAFLKLIEVLKCTKHKTSSIVFGVMNYPSAPYLEVEINIHATKETEPELDADEIMALEDEWFGKLSKYHVNDEKLASISFGIRRDDDFSREAS
ncbi:hypothetical protein [Aeromonas allosaccharophila]|uniref:hypothetical protein n=1 Tax=Aeromonas allosaccharophila TaxID=656 RepID=UPI0034313BB3